MKSLYRAITWTTFIPFMFAHPAFANAAPLSFDCDVPPDHYSSVSEDVTGLMTISGTVKLVQMRSGNNVPVAGARLVSADGKNSTGFQLIAGSAHGKQFSIVLNTKRGDDLRSSTVGQIGAGGAVTFSLSLSESGQVTLLIDGASFNADFIPMPSGKEMAFCSTGQFKFSDLTFVTASAPASPSIP
ncbi:hypothetical protein [Sphingomonas profundi]|uniref:hypothetical protein n=1 Tax=Alterirhizorhabdus profundi TaxID=2681549 RepID=UPI0012E892F9|nr:hypothetical protein [Sphingomonas profundi]